VSSRKPSRRVFTVDLEEYFQVEAFADVVPRDSWDSYPSRLAGSTSLLLDLLDEADTTGTFFVLGWVAQRHGALIREIARRGHELACHSYWHRLAYDLTRQEFVEDLLRSKAVIEHVAGVAVRGYRAPSFSITRHGWWILDTLAECGISYDSSIFPIHHDIYGMPEAPRRPFRTSGGLTVIPMTTFRWCRHNWPVAGGAYLRLLPWWYTRVGIGRAESEGIPVIGYVHPWELDPEQPRIRGRTKSGVRHYTGLHKTESRLRRLLALGGFSCFRDSELTNGVFVDENVTAGPTHAH
jgi:polysaccharide deacetylase family protein (PEP-CTERM system associated)